MNWHNRATQWLVAYADLITGLAVAGIGLFFLYIVAYVLFTNGCL